MTDDELRDLAARLSRARLDARVAVLERIATLAPTETDMSKLSDAYRIIEEAEAAADALAKAPGAS
jgi:hypothetical protein